MKSNSGILNRMSSTYTLAIVSISLVLPSLSYASQGAANSSPSANQGTGKSTSTGVSGSGKTSGGSSGSSGSGSSSSGSNSGKTVTLPPIPTTPIQPVATGTLVMTGSLYNGTKVQCAGTYRIDPYFPTLSLVTVDLTLSSVSGSDGAPMFVTLNVEGTHYPLSGDSFVIVGTGGTAHTQVYVSPGSKINSVTVLDLTGNIVASGK